MNCYATLTLVGLLASIGFALAASEEDAAATCALTNTKPTFDSSQLEAIKSNDSMLLAKMGAYLEFNENFADIKDGQKYLELHLREVYFFDSRKGARIYLFKADCANIKFSAPRGGLAEVEVYFPQEIKDTVIYCTAQTNYVLSLGHHHCVPIAYNCYRNGWDEPAPIAVLNFVEFEYEASNDLEMHENKKFAGTSSVCYY